MYAPGKILVMGGGDPPTNTAEVIDLNQSSPTLARCRVDGICPASAQCNAVARRHCARYRWHQRARVQ